jgi:hypothetical protein
MRLQHQQIQSTFYWGCTSGCRCTGEREEGLTRHMWGLSPVCTRRCFCRWASWVKLFWHRTHWNGRSPLCTRRWTCEPGVAKILLSCPEAPTGPRVLSKSLSTSLQDLLLTPRPLHPLTSLSAPLGPIISQNIPLFFAVLQWKWPAYILEQCYSKI